MTAEGLGFGVEGLGRERDRERGRGGRLVTRAGAGSNGNRRASIVSRQKYNNNNKKTGSNWNRQLRHLDLGFNGVCE